MASVAWEGWIYKQGSLMPTWKKRYMVLKGRHIAYYDKEVTNPRAKEKGTFTLAAVERTPAMELGLTLAGYDGKIMHIYTKTVGEFVLCNNAMTAACVEPERKVAPALSRAESSSMSYRHERSPSSANRAVTHSGWLEKEGQNVKSWKKRFFVLSGTDLTYYDRIGGSEKGGGRVVDVSYSYDRRNSLTFTLNNDRILNVTADSESEMQTWYNAACNVLGKAVSSGQPIFKFQSPQLSTGYGRTSSSSSYDNNNNSSHNLRAGSQGSSYSGQGYMFREASSSSADSNQYDPENYPSPPATYNPDTAAELWQKPAAKPVSPVKPPTYPPKPVSPAKPPTHNQAYPPKPTPTHNQAYPPKPVSPAYIPRPIAEPEVVEPVVEVNRSYNPSAVADVWNVTDPKQVDSWVEQGKASAPPVAVPAPSANLQSFLDKYMPADDAPPPVITPTVTKSIDVAKPAVELPSPVAIESPVASLSTQPIVPPVVSAPVIHPVIHPVIQPVIQPVVQPVVQPMVQPVIQPAVQPVVEVTRTVVQHVTVNQPVVQNVTMVQHVSAPITVNVVSPVASSTVAAESSSSDEDYERIDRVSPSSTDSYESPADDEDTTGHDVTPLVHVVPKSEYTPEVHKPKPSPLYVDTAPEQPLWAPAIPQPSPHDPETSLDDMRDDASDKSDEELDAISHVTPLVEVLPKSEFTPEVHAHVDRPQVVTKVEPRWTPTMPAPTPVVTVALNSVEVVNTDDHDAVVSEHVEGRCGIDCEHRVKAMPKSECTPEVHAPTGNTHILPPPRANYRHNESDLDDGPALAPLQLVPGEPSKLKHERKTKSDDAAPKSCCSVM
ncbi:hypothetical protein SPRG_02752 [Saprolegnia parasitica CBS 223.65]|uniref:PH domain-containing protein n=1 Tax=Saprolegnia parasitica (strain CBS 223.65) TaxID=695850 RepID=A0A067CP65_SAPPC|nr:hypothetical protein SPRG_02752 [Saprolegnia parasitica CBS 223.65]KDO32273.1 hypothetical protein SPRG_02752 [Saprolegnia parasitica CBS 223.65]|eukprot:XP_012196729.1 hypothetical protein SPRG_02752 [Saprolegnia parasitica CBS 223.65]